MRKRTRHFRAGRREGQAIRYYRKDNPDAPVDPRMHWAAAVHGRTNQEFTEWTRGFSAGLR